MKQGNSSAGNHNKLEWLQGWGIGNMGLESRAAILTKFHPEPIFCQWQTINKKVDEANLVILID